MLIFFILDISSLTYRDTAKYHDICLNPSWCFAVLPASYASYRPVSFSNDYTNALLLSYKDQGCRKVFLTGQAKLNNLINCVGSR